jgi:hypothetical protein
MTPHQMEKSEPKSCKKKTEVLSEKKQQHETRMKEVET